MRWLWMLLLVLACAAPITRSWSPPYTGSPGGGTLSVPLCAMCSGPYDAQKEVAFAEMQKHCAPEKVRILTEGVQPVGSITSGSVMGGTGWGYGMATNTSINEYFWTFKCVSEEH